MQKLDVLLLTPPMTQLNTMYPATAYLSAYLKSHNLQVAQRDLSLELALRIFSRSGLEMIFDEVSARIWSRTKARQLEELGLPVPTKLRIHKEPLELTEELSFYLSSRTDYIKTVSPVIAFLQGKMPALAYRIVQETFLPQGPRFYQAKENMVVPVSHYFGNMGIQEEAKYWASLYLHDLLDLIRIGCDSDFQLSRYAHRLAASVATCDELLQRLGQTTVIDVLFEELLAEVFQKVDTSWVALTVPFPGNVYGAFRTAQWLRKNRPEIKIVLGGGYVNTELRELDDPRVYKYFDALTYDDGEEPLVKLIQGAADHELIRTRVCRNNKVLFCDGNAKGMAQKSLPAPDYAGIDASKYLNFIEVLNPMHRLWSDGFWNKMTLAHGCYWKKCSFCDVSLDYIGRYDADSVDGLIQKMDQIYDQTRVGGFHFVDEAAPPALLKALSLRLVEQGRHYSWWGNLRFDKQFTPEVCQMMAAAGCIAVTGGLEVASDRILKLMQKGTTIEQVAKVSKAFSSVGVMVHAYLMYGFPTQTEQETIDSLEVVRQLFQNGCLKSAYWHRFSATVHSPVGKNPEQYEIKVRKNATPRGKQFAVNDLSFEDTKGCDHGAFESGLNKALYNYMHGIGLDEDVRAWFDFEVPKPKVSRKLIIQYLSSGIGSN